VSVLVAAHDAAATLPLAVRSILRQSLTDLELVVVDDCSTDETPALLAAVDDPRLVVVRNEENLGLAASLNRGLERARGRWIARLDADDVALPERLERQLALVERRPGLAVLGSAVLEIDAAGVPGARHVPPVGAAAVRWHALCSSPFFHPTVLVDREALDRHGLRYDERLGESEDYDLWTRLLAVADGDNSYEALTLRRVHSGQATRRRGDLQRSIQREVALREIGRVAPSLSPAAAELAWRVGAGLGVEAESAASACDAHLELLEAVVRLRPADERVIRSLAARRLARLGADGASAALRLDPLLPLRVARSARARRRAARADRARAVTWLRALDEQRPIRVAVVSPEPTPYRSPLLDRVAARPEVDLTVVYAAVTVAARSWGDVEPRHRAVFLDGVRVPGLRRLLRHDYPVTPGVLGALRAAAPDVVVVTGWSTFASQAALAWCRLRHVPYLLLVSSHDDDPRPGWRRAVKDAVVPRIVRGASGALVLGSRSRASLVARGAPPDRVRVFANTVDVEKWGRRIDALAPRRAELRAELGASAEDVVVLSVARLVPEKGLDVLVEAGATAGSPALLLVVGGDGPERAALEALAAARGVRLRVLGDVAWSDLPGVYAAADVFALVSRSEPWGVVVNEAAAAGLPLVLSDRVGAAPDLLEDGANGVLVPVGDAGATGEALRRLAGDPALRERMGQRSRASMQGRGYEPSVDAFVEAVLDATSR
jgi:glycosyltransferase involved in cell wall biosynthesis